MWEKCFIHSTSSQKQIYLFYPSCLLSQLISQIISHIYSSSKPTCSVEEGQLLWEEVLLAETSIFWLITITSGLTPRA